MRARMIVRGIFGVTAVATGLALCAPASAAPASRQTQQMTCDGFGSLLIVTPPTDHDSWSAAQVVGGGHLIPVSFRSLVQDDTADVVLYDGTVSHGPAHSRQTTTTCTSSFQAALGAIAPSGFVPPDGVAMTDVVTVSFIAVAVPEL